MMSENKSYSKIYTLTNPVTNSIYYVGTTKLSLSVRLECHTKTGNTQKTTGFLMSMGITPIIEELDTCPTEKRFELEEYWIHQIKAWGFQLDNRNNIKTLSGYQKIFSKEIVCTNKATPGFKPFFFRNATM